MALEKANQRIKALELRMGGGRDGRTACAAKELYTGVDIGTANVVTVVLDEEGNPVDGEIMPGSVVREGMVVDYFRAVQLVETQKQKLEERLGRTLTWVASAVPPGTEQDNGKITANILEAAGYEVQGIIDEPTAASLVMDIRDGAVVDVGGGTTGISVLKDGAVVFSADEATGGAHFDLVLAGGLGISISEAEKRKRDAKQQKRLLPVVRPVMEKVATITARYLRGHKVDQIYLAGGTCAFPGFAALMEQFLGVPVLLPRRPLLVTPLGIAMACRNMAMSGDRKKERQ